MKLIFFGTAGAVQTADNTNISFAVIEEPASILVDASGSPCQYLLRIGVAVSDFDALILTHAHPDHMHALPVLIQNLLLIKRKKILRIICNRATEKKAKKLLELFSILPEMETFPIEWVCGETPHKEFLDAGREGMHHLRFIVDNLEAQVEEARAHGYQSIWQKRFGEGLAAAYLEREGDPLIIEFFENKLV